MNFEKLKAEVPSIEIDHLDVTNGGQVEEVLKKYSSINVLFNCGGYKSGWEKREEKEGEKCRQVVCN